MWFLSTCGFYFFDKVSREFLIFYVTLLTRILNILRDKVSREFSIFSWQSLVRILDILHDKVSWEFSIFYMTKSRENSQYFTWQSLVRILDILRDKGPTEFSIFCVTNSRQYHWKQSQTNSTMTENKQGSIVLGRFVRVFPTLVLKLGEFI